MGKGDKEKRKSIAGQADGDGDGAAAGPSSIALRRKRVRVEGAEAEETPALLCYFPAGRPPEKAQYEVYQHKQRSSNQDRHFTLIGRKVSAAPAVAPAPVLPSMNACMWWARGCTVCLRPLQTSRQPLSSPIRLCCTHRTRFSMWGTQMARSTPQGGNPASGWQHGGCVHVASCSCFSLQCACT